MKIALIIFGIIVVVGGAIFFIAKPGNNTNNATNVNSSAKAQTSLNIGVSSGNVINITENGFSPNAKTIAVGQAIGWINNSSSTVYVAPDNHPSHMKYSGVWDDNGAGQISAGQTYTFTFTKAGTYTYHDHLNPSRTGTIIVQ